MDENDEPRPRKKYPVSISKLSKTPSWIMLGFVLGALFVIALPPMGNNKPAPPPEKPVEPPAAKAPPEPPQLTTIEAVFEAWREFAVWVDDTTEVALWSSEKRDFSDFYEVRRFGSLQYFRTIPSLSRPLIKNLRGLADDCPLRFTGPPGDLSPIHEVVSPKMDLRPARSDAPAPATVKQPEPPRVEAPPIKIEPPREK